MTSPCVRRAVLLVALICSPVAIAGARPPTLDRAVVTLADRVNADDREGTIAAVADLRSAIETARAALAEMDIDLIRRNLEWARPRVAERLQEHDKALASLADAAKSYEAAVTPTARAAAAARLAAFGEDLGVSQPYIPDIDLERGSRDPETLATASSRRRAVGKPSTDPIDLVTRPRPLDLNPTDDAPITPDIIAFAQRLGSDPRRIFAEVRNTIRYEPYQGTRKGAQLTLWQHSGSAWDIANLLAAALRAASYPVRYVRGTVVVSEERARKWLGVADATVAAAAMKQGGLTVSVAPNRDLLVDHAWVAVYAKAADGSTRWIQLDAAFKSISVHDPVPLPAMPNDFRTLLDRIDQTGALDTARRGAHGALRVPSASEPADFDADVDLIADHAGRRMDAVRATVPATLTGREAFGYQSIAAEPVPASLTDVVPLPLAANARIVAMSEIPADLHARLAIGVYDQGGRTRHVEFAAPLTYFAGKRITIAYVPATAADQTLVDQYGGSLLAVPPIIKVIPAIYVDGIEMRRGSPLAMGTQLIRRLTATDPPYPSWSVENATFAGDMVSVGLNYGHTSAAQYQAARERLGVIRNTLPKGPSGAPSIAAAGNMSEPVQGQFLFLALQAYFAQVDDSRAILANRFRILWFRGGVAVGVAMQSFVFQPGVNGPVKTLGAGLGFDIQADNTVTVSRENVAADVRTFNELAGTFASNFEHSTWEALGMRAVSTVRLLEAARLKGLSIYRVDKTNWTEVSSLVRLNVSALILITQAVQKGYEATIPSGSVTIGDWQGSGFVVTNPATGHAAQYITGELSAGPTLTRGGATADLLLRITAIGIATLINMRGDMMAIMIGMGLAIGSPEPLTKLAGVYIVYVGSVALFLDTRDATELANRDKDARVYVFDQAKNHLVKRFVLGRAGEMLADSARNIVRTDPKDFVDAAKEHAIWFGDMVNEWRKRNGKSGFDAAQPLTEEDLFALMFRSTSATMWEQLDAIRRTRGWATLDELIPNRAYLDEQTMEGVVNAIARAPNGDGVAAVIARVVSGREYNDAYTLRVARRLVVSRYERTYNVTYTPVVGFSSTGQPQFGTPTTEPLAVSFEYLTNWTIAWHEPIGRRDLRAWNMVRKAQAAADAKLTAYDVTFWTSGTVDRALRDWADANAPDVSIFSFSDDGF